MEWERLGAGSGGATAADDCNLRPLVLAASAAEHHASAGRGRIVGPFATDDQPGSVDGPALGALGVCPVA